MTVTNWLDRIIPLLSGGVIGSLITFFIKRHDLKREKASTFYHGVYNRLFEYNAALYDFMYGFIKNNADISDSITVSETNESSIINKIESLNKDINKYVRKCNKNGKPIDELCIKCKEKREQVSKLSVDLIEEQRKQSSLLVNQSSYWETRLDSLKDCAASYSNMAALLSSGGIAKKSIRNAVNKVDVKSISIIGYRKQAIKDEFDVSDLIIAQLENINAALKELSKVIKN